jgi:hypothetical protein
VLKRSAVEARDLTAEPELGNARPFQFRLRTLFIVITAIAVLLSVWKVLGLWMDYLEGPISERGFEKIEIGMRLEEVQAILGLGEHISAEHVTQAPGSPDAKRRGNLDLVIDGNEFYRWADATRNRRIEVGTRNGRVCDKFYWEPSL